MKSEFASFVNFLNDFANKSSKILTKKNLGKKFNFESKKMEALLQILTKKLRNYLDVK